MFSITIHGSPTMLICRPSRSQDLSRQHEVNTKKTYRSVASTSREIDERCVRVSPSDGGGLENEARTSGAGPSSANTYARGGISAPADVVGREYSEDMAAASAERQQLFNNIAPMYDQMQLNDWLSLGQHRIWKRMTVRWSRAQRGSRVLDLCCGSGDIALLAAEKVGPTGQVVGLDFAPEQLSVAARRQNKSFKASQVHMKWVEGDALALPFEDSSFDAVTMGYGLRNVVDIPQSLMEIRRVLKQGCSAAILDFNNSTNPWVAALQGGALDNVVVPVATRLGMASEYEYLRPSIERFPTGREQEQLAKEAGFSSAVHYETGFGLMGVLVVAR